MPNHGVLQVLPYIYGLIKRTINNNNNKKKKMTKKQMCYFMSEFYKQAISPVELRENRGYLASRGLIEIIVLFKTPQNRGKLD